MSDRAGKHGRVIDFGLRIHVIVRETEQEARDHARHIMSKADDELATRIRQSRDFQYTGTKRQDELRAASKDDYIEENVWSGIGRVRAGVRQRHRGRSRPGLSQDPAVSRYGHALTHPERLSPSHRVRSLRQICASPLEDFPAPGDSSRLAQSVAEKRTQPSARRSAPRAQKSQKSVISAERRIGG